MLVNNLEKSDPTKDFYNFSSFLGEKFNVPCTVFMEHTICSVSVALAKTKIESAQKELLSLYEADSNFYDQYAISNGYYESILLTKAPLETELLAKKILGLMLVSESDLILRRKLIQIMSHLYPHLYKTVKKHNFKYLNHVYDKIETFTYSATAFYERAIFLYLTLYCSPDWIDENILYAITQTMYEEINYHPLHSDIEVEIEGDKKALAKLKNELEISLDSDLTLEHMTQSDSPALKGMAQIFTNLFYLNKLDIHDFLTDINEDSLNKILLSQIKQDSYTFSQVEKNYLTTASLFLQPLIEEYQKTKKFYYNNNQKMDKLLLENALKEKQQLKVSLSQLQDTIIQYQEKEKLQQEAYQSSLLSAKKSYDSEISSLNHKLKDLQRQLEQEKNYRQELNKLREYIFSLDIPVTIDTTDPLSLKEHLEGKKIIVVGGPRQWRRKLRESFPFLDTLSGTSTNFDLSIFVQIDCVLFYTNYMSHSIYNKAMNYIRTNNLKFGYIKSTNVQLIEAEIIEILKQCEVIKE